jgi:hypothetical protein
MRLITSLAASFLLLICIAPVGALRAEDSPWLHRLHYLHGIHKIAEAVCHWRYLENRLRGDQKEELRKYCSRLEHPVNWAQEQQWWKDRLPDFMQGLDRDSLYRQPDSHPLPCRNPNEPCIPPRMGERYVDMKIAECAKLPRAEMISCMRGLLPPSSDRR